MIFTYLFIGLAGATMGAFCSGSLVGRISGDKDPNGLVAAYVLFVLVSVVLSAGAAVEIAMRAGL